MSEEKWRWFPWLRQYLKGYEGALVIAMITTVLSNALQLTVPFFSQQIIDLFFSGSGNPDMGLFTRLLIGMIGLTFFRCGVVYFECMKFERVSQDVIFHIRSDAFSRILMQDMAFYRQHRTGDLMPRVTGDLDAVRHMIAWTMRMVVGSLALVIATVTYFWIMNPLLCLTMLVVAPALFYLMARFRSRSRAMHRVLREKFAILNTAAQENISGNRVVKAFAREDYEIEKFDAVNRDYRDTAENTAMLWLKYFPFVESFANLLPVLLLLVGGIFLIRGQLTLGEYMAFSGLTWGIANPMRQLGAILNQFQRFLAASEKIRDLCESRPVIQNLPDASPAEKLRGEIAFENVSFRYADGGRDVLSHISFSVKPGETLAIIGETGCGKTTLLNLIPRFLEATSGRVLVDGKDVRSYRMADLRRNIGFATQEVLLFSDTVENNIGYGRLEISADETARYAKYAAADTFIRAMPEGYRTIVGERGVGLSGGQKQRIALARALAMRPAILILDDTTSAVDMETEEEIRKQLEKLDFTCTRVMVAQRVSTTRRADRILVMKDGRVAEEGTHAELVKKNGIYAGICTLQTESGAV